MARVPTATTVVKVSGALSVVSCFSLWFPVFRTSLRPKLTFPPAAVAAPLVLLPRRGPLRSVSAGKLYTSFGNVHANLLLLAPSTTGTIRMPRSPPSQFRALFAEALELSPPARRARRAVLRMELAALDAADAADDDDDVGGGGGRDEEEEEEEEEEEGEDAMQE